MRACPPLGSQNAFVGLLDGGSTSNKCDLRHAVARVDRHDVGDAPQQWPCGKVVPKLVDHKPVVSPRLGGAEQPDGEGDADASTLPGVGHDKSHLGAIVIAGDNVAERDDVAAVVLVQLRHQSQPPRVVDVSQRAENWFGQRGGRRVESKVSRPRTQTREEFAHRAVFARP